MTGAAHGDADALAHRLHGQSRAEGEQAHAEDKQKGAENLGKILFHGSPQFS